MRSFRALRCCASHLRPLAFAARCAHASSASTAVVASAGADERGGRGQQASAAFAAAAAGGALLLAAGAGLERRAPAPARAEVSSGSGVSGLRGQSCAGSRVFVWGQRAAFPVSEGSSVAPPQVDLRTPTEVPWFSQHAERESCQWRQIAFGPSFGVARTDRGELFAWGSCKNGEGKRDAFLKPQPLLWDAAPAGSRFVDAQCSESAIWALTGSGEVVVWERVPRLVADRMSSSSSSSAAAGLVGGKRVSGCERPIRQMSVGTAHAAFITDEGDVYCLGSNRFGECGADPSTQGFASACRLIRLPRHVNPVLHVRCGRSHTVAIGAEGQVLAWGDDSKIQLGLGDTRSNTGDERPWEGSRGYLNFVATGESMAPAAATRGGPSSPTFAKARPTSAVRYGEFEAHLQWKPSMMMDIPLEFERQVHGTPYPPPDGVVCGDDFTVLIVRDSPDWFAPEEESNRLFCCGENGKGQCGRSLQSSQQIFSATKLPRNSFTDTLSCGSNHCMAVLQRHGHRKRELWAWGSNEYGQAGGSSGATACPAVRLRLPRDVRIRSAWCGFQNSAAICIGRGTSVSASDAALAEAAALAGPGDDADEEEEAPAKKPESSAGRDSAQ